MKLKQITKGGKDIKFTKDSIKIERLYKNESKDKSKKVVTKIVQKDEIKDKEILECEIIPRSFEERLFLFGKENNE